MLSQEDLEELNIWAYDREGLTALLEASIDAAIEADDPSRFIEIVLGYIEWKERVNRLAKQMLDDAVRAERGSPSDAIIYYRPAYDLLETDREWILAQPAFERLFARLGKGAAESKTIGRLLGAVTRKIEAPPDLAWLGNPLRRMRTYQGNPLELVAKYEVLHNRVRKIWFRYKRHSHRRHTALRHAFPCLLRRTFSRKDDPQHVTMRIIATRGSNVCDLRRDCTRARKIKRILVAVTMADTSRSSAAQPALEERFAAYVRRRLASSPTHLEFQQEPPAPASCQSTVESQDSQSLAPAPPP